MYIQTNTNPLNNDTGDCVIRAISLAIDKSWDEVYTALSVYGYDMKDWGNSNAVWNRYLLENGFKRDFIPSTCPYCYTVSDFCNDHPIGNYLLASGQHLVCVKNSNYMDSWNSGGMIPIYYYWKD